LEDGFAGGQAHLLECEFYFYQEVDHFLQQVFLHMLFNSRFDSRSGIDIIRAGLVWWGERPAYWMD
jgi:hypothetical protein